MYIRGAEFSKVCIHVHHRNAKRSMGMYFKYSQEGRIDQHYVNQYLLCIGIVLVCT